MTTSPLEAVRDRDPAEVERLRQPLGAGAARAVPRPTGHFYEDQAAQAAAIRQWTTS